jgi:hypothetical protein
MYDGSGKELLSFAGQSTSKTGGALKCELFNSINDGCRLVRVHFCCGLWSGHQSRRQSANRRGKAQIRPARFGRERPPPGNGPLKVSSSIHSGRRGIDEEANADTSAKVAET